jgi:hypothetical protein
MAFNYTKAQRTALRLLTENGRAVTLVKYSTESADPNRPWRGAEGIPDTTITVTAVFTDPVSEKDLGSAEVMSQGGIKRGEQIAFMAASENLDANGVPLDLTLYDQMIDGGRAYTMVEIHTLSPGGVPLMYEVRLES